MSIFGKQLSEYVAFSKPVLVLLLVVGLARLGLSLGGAPNSAVRWFSISAVVWIGVLYYAVRVYTTGFGGYKQLFVVAALLNLVAQAIAIVAIVIAILTGTPNIFSAPEYAFGADGKTWSHVAAHVFVGTTVGSLAYWLAGCLFMFVSRKLLPSRGNTNAAARA